MATTVPLQDAITGNEELRDDPQLLAAYQGLVR